MYSRESEVLSPGAKLAYLGLKKVLERTGTSQSITNSLNRVVTDVVSSLPQEAANDVIKKSFTACAEYLKSEEGLEKTEQISSAILDSFIKSFAKSAASRGIVVSDVYTRVGTHLVYGLTYYKFSGDCQNLIVMSGYVFGELLGFASMKTSVIIMCIKSMYETLTNEQPSCLVVQSESDPNVRTGPLVEFLTAVWQAVSAFFGIAREMPTSIVDFFYALRYGMFFANNTMNTVFQFFGSICSIVRYIYAWISDVCFGVKAYSRLLYQDNSIMKIWAKEVQEVTDPKNECLVMDNASWHSRLVSAYMVSKYFQQETCRAGTKDTPPFLLQTHKQLHLLYTKSLNLGITSSIRPEPTCIWVSGPPGLGKTYMKDAVIVKLLRSCGIRTTGNDIYTMNFSQKHWTGAENKAVVYYDDFGTIDSPEVIAEAVGQFMQLVSDARFSPPQAAVEDKGKPIAPYIVYCNSNEANPEYMCVRDKVAFHRRRHFCIEVVRSPEFVRAFNQDANLETEGAKNWVESNKTETNSTPHVLYFFRAPVGGARLSQNMTFETMLSQLVTKVVGRYDVEMAKFQRKVDLLSNFTTITTETPLVEVLSEIERRSNALSYDAETVRRLFSSAYSISTSYLKESSDVIKGWFNQITESSSQIPTVQDGVCECDVRMHVRCEFVDSKLVWRTGDELHGQEIKYECTSEACPLKTEEWQHRVQGAAARGAISQQLCKHILAIIKGDEPAPVSTYVPAAEAQLSAEIEQLQATVPKTEIPAVVRIGTIALSGLSAFYVTHKVMNYFNFPGIIPMLLKKKESSKIIGSGEDSVSATVPDVATTIPAPRGSVVTELISSGDNHTSNAARSRGGIQKKTFVATAEGLTLETQYAQQLLPLLDKATGFLVLDGTDRSSQLPVKGFVMRVFCLKGQWIILPKHYYTKILRTDDYSLKYVDSRSTSFVDGITLTHIKELNDSELMFAKLPVAVPAFKDMSKHFMSQADFRRLTNKAFAYERDLGKAPVNHALNISVRREVVYNDVGGTFVLPMAFEYAWQAPGRCMTPIYSHFAADKIIGFHVAGGDESVSGSGKPVGIAEPMIFETLAELDTVQDLSAQGPLEIPGFVEEANGKFRFNTNLVEVGFVEPRFSAHTPDKTSIVPSLIHGYLPPTTRPAPLKPADVDRKFSPMVVGCDKHGLPPKQFDPALLSRAKEALRQQYLSACKPVRMEVGILSETDAILGLEGLDGYQAMDLGTSEGFPFTSYREKGRTSKRQLFDIDAERTSVGIDPRLINVMIAKEEMRSNGVIPATVFVDCLKDARIPITKYFQGKTRVFSISPVDFTIQFRQYFLDILAAQKINRLDLEHAVGINVHSIEWTLLARRLISKGQSILCGDYSNFGPGLSSQVVHAVGEVWCEWYAWHEERQGITETEIARRRRTRLCMFEEMRHSIHLAGNVLYQALCGSPSGTPATVNINNDVNKLYIYMAWFTCFADNPVMNNIVSFRKHCSLFVYGDDLVCGVSDAVKDKFNNEFLQSFLADHGIKYTDETKSDTITKFVDFREAGFLKGTWVPHPTRQGIFTYGLAKSAVEDVANWCFTSVDPEAATRQACCDSLLLAYGQGPSYYKEHRERLINAWCGLLGVGNLSLYTYEEVDNMRFGWDQTCIPDLDLDDVLKKEKEWRDKNAKENELSFDLMDLMY